MIQTFIDTGHFYSNKTQSTVLKMDHTWHKINKLHDNTALKSTTNVRHERTAVSLWIQKDTSKTCNYTWSKLLHFYAFFKQTHPIHFCTW